MGQKDIAEKILEDYNDVFADIINGLLFDGDSRNQTGRIWKIQPFMHSTKQRMTRFTNWSVILQNTGKRKR